MLGNIKTTEVKGRVPIINKEVEERSSASGPVVKYTLSPEELQRVRDRDLPKIKLWEPTLTHDQYVQLRADGMSRQDIMLKWFNNEQEKLAKQLREWKLLSAEKEREEMAVKSLDGFTRDQYLVRRAAGESRTKIMKSLNLYTSQFYTTLDEWGLRDKDQEAKVLAELVTDNEPRGLIAFNEERDASGQGAPEEEAPFEQAAAVICTTTLPIQAQPNQESELPDLRQAAALWQSVAERESNSRKLENENAARVQLQNEADMARLTGIITDLTEARDKHAEEAEEFAAKIRRRDQQLLEMRNENARLSDELKGAIVVTNQASERIIELETENQRLKEIDERDCDISVGLRKDNDRLKSEIRIANEVMDSMRNRIRELEGEREINQKYVFLRVPILSGDHPIRQRIRVYDGIERFTDVVESSKMNRERATDELFELIQLFVSLIQSELEDLHPGQGDVFGYVKKFFFHHNQKHLEGLRQLGSTGTPA